MKVVALISGGKDSMYNQLCCIQEGHEIVALANLHPPLDTNKDELDSYMYQTVGHDAIHYYAECMDIPLYRQAIDGASTVQTNAYDTTRGDETEDLFKLLKTVKQSHPEVQGVSVGAILSNYQRIRVEHVCSRLGLTSLAYLWRRDQAELLNEMVNAGVNAILIKVAAIGLDTKHLGKSLAEMQAHLLRMNQMYDLHVCGEGGEYETFTLDCPLFKKRIHIDDSKIIMHSDDAFAPVAYLRIKSASLLEKGENEIHVSRGGKLATLDIPKRALFSPDEQQIVEDISAMPMSQDAPFNPRLLISPPQPTPAYLPTVSISHTHICISSVSAFNSSQARNTFTIQDESESMLAHALELLSQHSLNTPDLSSITLYLRDMSDFVAVNEVYKRVIGFSRPPVRVCIASASLPGKCRMIMDLTASQNASRETLHVQSLSYWAPANIGPYSQGVNVRSTTSLDDDVSSITNVFIAGMIAMDPRNLQVLSNTIEQAVLSLKHIGSVMQVLTEAPRSMSRAECITKYCSSAVCYLASEPSAFQELYTRANGAWRAYVGEAFAAEFPVLYVMVSHLPKAAKVEWQIAATVHSDEVESNNLSAEGQSHLDKHLTYDVQSYSRGTARLGQGIVSASSEKIQFESLLDATVSCLDKIIDAADRNSISLIRIFYLARMVNADEIEVLQAMLQNGILEYLCRRNMTASVSLLAVVAMSKGVLAMSVQ